MNLTSQQILADYYAAHRNELLRYVSSRLVSCSPSPNVRRADTKQEAEDIVQDVFLRLLTTGHLISSVTLPCLVCTTARRLVTDRLRHWLVAEQYEHYIKGRPYTADSPQESVFSANELTRRLEHSLARLSEDCREIYRLHIYHGMKVSEIASQLGQDYRSVEYRLGIARKLVRHALAASG